MEHVSVVAVMRLATNLGVFDERGLHGCFYTVIKFVDDDVSVLTIRLY